MSASSPITAMASPNAREQTIIPIMFEPSLHFSSEEKVDALEKKLHFQSGDKPIKNSVLRSNLFNLFDVIYTCTSI